MIQDGAFVIACGGTGGHLFPGLAVAEEFRRRGRGVLLLVSNREIDAVALRDHPGFPSEVVDMVGMPKPFSPAMLGFVRKLLRERGRCVRLLRRHRARGVLGMGGFTSTPPVLAARRLRIPAFIHESNAYPGKANRLTARFCAGVFAGTEECRPWFPQSDVRVVGTPIRTALKSPVDRDAAYAHFGLNRDLETLVVMGGSQGASGVNRAVCACLDLVNPKRFQIIHFTGAQDEGEVRGRYAETAIRHHVAAFCSRMEYALQVADLVVSRSGGSSLAELAYFGIPAVFIPYPYAADDHQTRNAEPYVRRGAAVLLRQDEALEGRLRRELAALFGDRPRREAMGRAMREFSSEDATVKICKLMEEASE
ncbi:MAG TPA: undecaprenyldiphospho-muramoylpentapeptide beta-N-acetylglucosaminyltransferase [Verrucomicrobiales bacterium]|nr:undecaprenyldiphospho-muramoylpentapeptide beta-N-acetylglucosaminyltransferase [Verrucomicrobiales bacterium]